MPLTPCHVLNGGLLPKNGTLIISYFRVYVCERVIEFACMSFIWSNLLNKSEAGFFSVEAANILTLYHPLV